MTRTQSHLNEKMMVSDKKVKWKWRQPGPGCDTNPTFEWLCSSKYFFVKVECRCWQFVFFFWYNPMIQRRTFPCSSCSSLLLWDHNENFTFGIDPNSNSTKQLNFSPCSVIPACIRIPCSSRNSLQRICNLSSSSNGRSGLGCWCWIYPLYHNISLASLKSCSLSSKWISLHPQWWQLHQYWRNKVGNSPLTFLDAPASLVLDMGISGVVTFFVRYFRPQTNWIK